MNEITRRNFVKGTAVAAGLVGCPAAFAAEAEGIEWEATADVVVIGTGAAGFSTATWFVMNEQGSALILETADEPMSGGNSRVCGQGVLGADDPVSAASYLNGLNLPYVVDQELVDAWANEIWHNNVILNEYYDGDMQITGGGAFDAYEGASAIRQFNHGGKAGDQACWLLLRDKAEELDIPVFYETRAVELITANGEVIGVKSEDGRCFKALKGVVLACGGFENNMDMMQCYRPIGCEGTVTRGTWTNVGDGIKMALAVGADLWHMNSFSGGGWSIKITSKDDALSVAPIRISGTHDYIYVSREGKRFQYEEASGMHGKQMRGSTWYETDMPSPSFMIFGQKTFDLGKINSTSCWAVRNAALPNLSTTEELLEAGIIVRCENVADIAAATGIPEEYLQETLDTYNANAAQNIDPLFGRGQALSAEGTLAIQGTHPYSGMTPNVQETSTAEGRGSAGTVSASNAFDLEQLEFPLYVTDLIPSLLNTFGGPKRGAHGEVISMKGQPIPRLFEAGELGAIYANKYNGGSAFGEAISSGRIAAMGVGALERWAQE